MEKASKKSLDDIFNEDEEVSKAGTLEDIFGLPSAKPKALRVPKGKDIPIKNLRPAVEALGSIPLGAAKTLSMGYLPFPEQLESAMQKNPGMTSVGNVIGGFGPGMAMSKLISTVAPRVAASAAGSGALAGGLEGALYNPGENGSRINNMLLGLGLSGTIGSIAGAAKRAGQKVDVLDQLNEPENYSRKIQDKINQGIETVRGKIAPLKSELLSSLEGRTVQINPEELRGWARPKTRGTPSASPGTDPVTGLELNLDKTFPEQTLPKTTQTRLGGGLDRLAYRMTEKPPVAPGRQVREIPAKQGQRLKEYFDRLTDYQAERMYQEGAKASEDKAYAAANKLRDKLAQASPEVGPLNEKMSKMYKLINQIKKMSEGGPLSTVGANPMTDKGQLVKEFDQLAGTDLEAIGELFRSVKKIAPSDATSFLQPLERIGAMANTAQRGIGRGYNMSTKGLEKVPGLSNLSKSAKDSLILSILENARRNRTEFTPEEE